MKDILSDIEVAEILDCETTTVHEKARTGELPGVKFGRSWRFPRTALLEVLHQRAMQNKPKATPVAVAHPVNTKVRKLPPALPSLHAAGG